MKPHRTHAELNASHVKALRHCPWQQVPQPLWHAQTVLVERGALPREHLLCWLATSVHLASTARKWRPRTSRLAQLVNMEPTNLLKGQAIALFASLALYWPQLQVSPARNTWKSTCSMHVSTYSMLPLTQFDIVWLLYDFFPLLLRWGITAKLQGWLRVSSVPSEPLPHKSDMSR